MALRLVFMGTPDFSVPTLTALVGQGHEIAAVYTQPPRPAGRGMQEKKSPVHEAAERFGIPVHTPASLKSEDEKQRFRDLQADAAIVVAYGLILPEAILSALELGAWNGHASLLPRWRGAAPIQRAIMAGDEETGVMIMQMETGLDTGPVAMAERVSISPDVTAGELHDVLAATCADLMVRAVAALERGLLDTRPQPEEGITYAEKIGKEEARIDWSKPARDVHNHIRGLSPFPGAWTEIEFNGKPVRLKILASELSAGNGQPGEVIDNRFTIACGEGALQILRVQRAGKAVQVAEEFLRGNRIDPGMVLG